MAKGGSSLLFTLFNLPAGSELTFKVEMLLLLLAGAENGSFIMTLFKVSALNAAFDLKIDLIVFGPETVAEESVTTIRGSVVFLYDSAGSILLVSSFGKIKPSATDNPGLSTLSMDTFVSSAKDFTKTRQYHQNLLPRSQQSNPTSSKCHSWGIFLYKTPNQAYQLIEDKVLLKLDWAKNQKTKSSLNKIVAFAAEGSNNSNTDKIMTRIDAMTMKMDAQCKDFQSRSKQSNLDDDDIPMPLEEEANSCKPSVVLIFTMITAIVIQTAITEEDFDDFLDEGSEILHSIKGTILEEKLFARFNKFMAMTADVNSKSESNTEEPPFKKITFNTNYKIKKSLEEPPMDIELKPLPDNLEYVFLD
uniref:Reverse transcriptase domain-containing protein n=1 Tax=Tanacetum cinerariifolium TaxID=118510 RepID=A0A6L2L6K8_TANCI|nr:reverse transcriptase domain-containing protein [Tanacetum cinerariifolium]